MRILYQISLRLAILSFLAASQVATGPVQAQIIDKSIPDILKQADRSEFTYIPKKPGHYTVDDWRAVIDSTWGQGLSTAKKLQLFDYCWEFTDKSYPSFFHIADTWQSLRDVYRPEIAAGVTRGRFSAIMNHMYASLTDIHSLVCDIPVSQGSIKPGIPLFVTTGVDDMFPRIYHITKNSHFGAGLAPLPDSTVFVYSTVQDHPLGLEPGDVVLGYENIPWKILYKELLAAELPIHGSGTYGSNPPSITHGFLTAAGGNWHLFDTIDILKYDSGDTLHLPTALLADQQMEHVISEQLPVPGVPFPDVDNGHLVSWGIVEGTNTGYIYTWGWTRAQDLPAPSFNSGDEFLGALQTLVNEYQIDGLIIDSRFNIGGYTYQYLKCLSFLFNEDQDIFREYIRDDHADHFSLKDDDRGILKTAATSYLFDRPIAMLIGPMSASCGDLMPSNMRKHPMVRTFGLATNGAYGAVDGHDDFSVTYSDWVFRTTHSNIIMTENPNLFLTHLNIPPDEEIWFTQEDAVRQEDTVVKRALEWISNLTYSHDISVDPLFAPPLEGSFFISAQVENPNQHPVEVVAMIRDAEGMPVDSVQLTDISISKEFPAGARTWGADWIAPEGEKSYAADIITKDHVDSTVRTLRHISSFTTIGPIIAIDNEKPYIEGEYDASRKRQNLKFILQNAGSQTTAEDIRVVISTDDPRVYAVTYDTRNWGDMAGGVTDTSGYYIFQYDSGYGPESTVEDPIKFDLDIYSKKVLYWTINIDYTTGIEELAAPLPPRQFELLQNYPNPFNPITNIEFRLPLSQFVSLKVYNLLGQIVAELVDKKLQAGKYKFAWNAQGYASGIYLYQLKTANGFQQTRKLVLLK